MPGDRRSVISRGFPAASRLHERRDANPAGPVLTHFTWSAEESDPLLLVAGGAGLAPLMSMLRHRAERDVAGASPRDGLRIERAYTRALPPG